MTLTPISRAAEAFFRDPDITYFNTAAFGPGLTAVAAAGEAAARGRLRPWSIDFFTESDGLRAKAARLFNASAEHIALVPAVSYGLAAAAKNLQLARGQEIVLLDGQFPSNVYCWRDAAAGWGARIVTVRRDSQGAWTDAVLDAVGPNTGLVAVPGTHWSDGGALDLNAIAQAVRACGAGLVLDLSQSLGAVPFDAAAVDPDFAVAAGYKWLLGPYSLGFLYVAERHWSGAGLEQNWIARKDPHDLSRLAEYRDGFEPGARRYDMGERSNFQLVPMASTALDQVLHWTPEAIGDALSGLTARIADRLAPCGLTTEAEPLRSPHYLSFALPDGTPPDLVDRLRADGVHVSKRGPRLRVTGYLHTRADDIDRLEASLARVLGG
ncbi:MAG: aminotransferase class V-fold PLP-dependent enzyme [Maricaulaceae bacterium]